MYRPRMRWRQDYAGQFRLDIEGLHGYVIQPGGAAPADRIDGLDWAWESREGGSVLRKHSSLEDAFEHCESLLMRQVGDKLEQARNDAGRFESLLSDLVRIA